MEVKTNALRMLDKVKADYKCFHYEPDSSLTGGQIAALLGQNPEQVFKTLVTVGKSHRHYVFMLPVEKELDLKKAAVAAGEKSVEMLKQKELFGLTGYVHGGCSPIGMKKSFTTVIHNTATDFSTLIFSAGKVGVQVETSLDNLQKIVKFKLADICVD